MDFAQKVTDRRLRRYQNRERTGVPARAARVGWWMRPAIEATVEGNAVGIALILLNIDS